jgi:alpha-aminoadipate/glutamate carrier protein LysW
MTAIYRITVVSGGIESMVTCPECKGAIDVDEEDLDEGDPLSCDECGAELRVSSTDPLELESAEEFAEDEEDADLIEDEDEEEAEDEDWK